MLYPKVSIIVKFETYHFEIKDILAQFINAFDEVVISRFDKDRNVVDKLEVRYVYAPKQRVLHDLINKAQHITLPVVALVITNITRDTTRVFNKIAGMQTTSGSIASALRAGTMLQPVPIDITVNMSILTRYQTDMDQIITNFVPYNDPYITISWKKSNDNGSEIRSTVHWSGNLALDYPIDLNSAQPARVACDTSFVIKGWLFKYDYLSSGYIFNIDSEFTAVKQIEDLDTMNALRSADNTDSRWIHGYPQITFVAPYLTSLSNPVSTFDVFGRMFDDTQYVWVSGNTFVEPMVEQNPFDGNYLETSFPAFSGVPVEFHIDSTNLLTFTMPSLSAIGKVDIIVANKAGYSIMTVDTTSLSSTYQYPFSNGISVV